MDKPENDRSVKDEQITLQSSELESLKVKFVESEKLAFIGKLTAGILHEIKNPLNFINNFARLSQQLVAEINKIIEADGGKLSENSIADVNDTLSMLNANVAKILENGERAQRIVFSMLAQTRDSQRFTFEPCDLNKLVEEFSKLAYQGVRGNDNKFNVTFRMDWDPTIGLVNLGLQEMSRVIINFVNNACFALEEKRKTAKENYSPEILLATRKHDDFAEIRIRDNGTGIPQAIIDKLFTPFFTTKPIGEGTGLGLSLSRDIITNIHKGKIELETKENEFTEFRIFISLHLSN